jgi:hypothetical protein
MHPDQEAALEGLAEALTGALGVPVRVAPRAAGCRVEMSFSNLGEARELIERLERRRAA